NDAKEMCGDIHAREGSPQYAPAAERQKLDSCFVFAQGKPGTADAGKSVLALVHSRDSVNIRHNGVRLFGFLFAQFIPRLKDTTNTAGQRSFDFDASMPLG